MFNTTCDIVGWTHQLLEFLHICCDTTIHLRLAWQSSNFRSLPRSPLSRASAKGGLRSFNKDSSWGLASNMSRSKAGLSRPWGDEATSPGDEWDCWAPAGWRCRVLDVPGTAMLRKSIRGKSVGENRFEVYFKWLHKNKYLKETADLHICGMQ